MESTTRKNKEQLYEGGKDMKVIALVFTAGTRCGSLRWLERCEQVIAKQAA